MIHIVTAYTRTPVFLNRIYKSIEKLNIECHWYIVTTKKDVDVTNYKNTTVLVKEDGMPMHSGVNHYYDKVEDTGQWVYALDDDNLMHENFTFVVPHTQVPGNDMLVVSQQLKNGVRTIENVESIAVMKIDQAQFLVRRSAVSNLRYWLVYRGDGHFAAEMRIKTLEACRGVIILYVVASYYNAQTEIFPV